ncbi:MAG TPA: hypothetical protein VLD65_07420 [Anaerolineales bacterium]|nr:hypothetical protein [Anaerolineales bacterium]
MMDGYRKALHKVTITAKSLVYLLMICLPFALASCKKDPKVSFIQGEWYYKDKHLANIPGESAQETKWYFDNGYFSMDSCCFVKTNITGYYSISDRSEDKLMLDLFNLEGQQGGAALHRDDTTFAEIKIDFEADTMMINSSGPYTRISP